MKQISKKVKVTKTKMQKHDATEIEERNESSKQSNQEVLQLFRSCIPLFSVLSDETRQEIVLIIANSLEEGIIVNAITEQVSLSRPAVSHHLKILKQSGIIGVKKKGVENYYYLTLLDAVTEFKKLLDAVEKHCILR